MSNHHTKFLILHWNNAEQGWNKAGTARNNAEQRGTRRRYPPKSFEARAFQVSTSVAKSVTSKTCMGPAQPAGCQQTSFIVNISIFWETCIFFKHESYSKNINFGFSNNFTEKNQNCQIFLSKFLQEGFCLCINLKS